MPFEPLLVVYSYHHKNTEKVATTFAQLLGAAIVSATGSKSGGACGTRPRRLRLGIDSGRHYASLLNLADRLPTVTGKKAFIFSTCGAPAFAVTQQFILKNHSALREKLQAKGYTIVDEFGCPGFNTNSLLRFFGGLNKGRPNAKDLRHAEAFASNLEQVTRQRRITHQLSRAET